MHDLARTTTLRHKPSGATMKTPILVPSFSSKGFSYLKDGMSEVRQLVELTKEFIADAVLISAYDVHHGHVHGPQDFPIRAELTFVDSGGYEVSQEYDYSSVIRPPVAADEWSVEHLVGVYESWSPELPAVFTSYDHPNHKESLDKQVSNAKELFSKFPDQMHLMLVKPGPSRTTLQEEIKEIEQDPGVLADFDIIGVTEKEIGASMLDRMANVARLRIAMDDAGITSPIHVFGSLDPISVILYFLAGAEIFDGLTWLRYGYKNSMCVYTHDVGATDFGLHVPEASLKTRIIAKNLYAIEELRLDLETFVVTGNVGRIREHGELAQKAWDELQTRIGRRS